MIPVVVLLEKLQGTLGQGNDQLLARQVLRIHHQHHSRTALHQDVEVLLGLQQLCHGLRCIGFEVHIAQLVAHHEAIHQIVELTHEHFLRSRCLVHASGTFHVIIVQQLGCIAFQLGVDINLIDGFERLCLLFQVIIVYRRCNGELRAGIMEPAEEIGILQGLLILAYALDATERTVAVVVEFLVHGRALAYLHHPHIGHQAFQLVGGDIVYLGKEAVRLLEMHTDESAEGQVVQRLGLHGCIPLAQLQRLLGQCLRQVPVLVPYFVRLAVQGVGLAERISFPSSLTAGKERHRRAQSGHP